MMGKQPPRMSRLPVPRRLVYTDDANADIDKIGRDYYENLIEGGVAEVAALLNVMDSPCICHVACAGGWFRFKRFKIRVAFYVNGQMLTVTAVLKRDNDTYRIIHHRWNEARKKKSA